MTPKFNSLKQPFYLFTMWSISNSRRYHLGSSWSPSHSCSPEIGWTVIIWRLSWTGCRLRAQLGLLAPHLHPVSQCSWIFSLQSHRIPRAIIFRGRVSRAQRANVPRDGGRSCKTSLDLMLKSLSDTGAELYWSMKSLRPTQNQWIPLIYERGII